MVKVCLFLCISLCFGESFYSIKVTFLPFLHDFSHFTMVLLVGADSCGQSGKSKCLQELLKEPGTIVVLLKLAKVWQILIYDGKFS